MSPLLNTFPNIDDFICYNLNNDFFNFKLRLSRIIDNATHIAFIEDFINKDELENYPTTPHLKYSNWLAFKTFEKYIIYKKLKLDNQLIADLKECDSFDDLVFKNDQDFLSPLFFKGDELLFCSVHTDGLIFIKEEKNKRVLL
jgi:hypothetical protein